MNRTPIEILEPEIARAKIMEPLLQAGDEVWKQVDMDVRTSGGGYMGQAEAARMAVANALLKWTKSGHLRTVFTEYDRTMIVGDSRSKEPKSSVVQAQELKNRRATGRRMQVDYSR